MVRLYRSSAFQGNRTCIERDPEVTRLHDHVFNPDPTLGCPGIYDYGRKLVLQSIYSRGPSPADVLPGMQSSFTYNEVTAWAPQETYIYLGLLHPHYGHFLLSTFSRLWNIRDLPDHDIICVGPSHISEPAKPYVKDLLRALNINPDRLVSFPSPVKVHEIILPYPSFEEQNFTHRAFSRLCNDVGDRLASEASIGQIEASKPIYFSKEHITSGVRKIVNEADICEHLAREGVEIMYPERLTFANQVALWRSARPIVSFSSSGLHTSVFSRHSRIICLSHDPYINSSFYLIDWASGSDAAYFHFEPGAFESLGPSADFIVGLHGMSDELRADDPRGVADAILRAIDQGRGLELPGNNGVDLSRGRPTTQSSSSHESEAGGPSATSGFLTGRFQFHTCHEDEPWWQVDLGTICNIQKIHVFNRTDSGAERASRLRVQISSDAVTYDLVYAREEEAAFGGLNGEALQIVFDRAHLGRYVRLSVPGPNFFHLDQVKVIGNRQDPFPRAMSAVADLLRPSKWSRGKY